MKDTVPFSVLKVASDPEEDGELAIVRITLAHPKSASLITPHVVRMTFAPEVDRTERKP
jgi:hypothetical protein